MHSFNNNTVEYLPWLSTRPLTAPIFLVSMAFFIGVYQRVRRCQYGRTYKYEPLPDVEQYVRLLSWEQSSSESNQPTLRFSTSTCSLSALARTRYAAISYTWQKHFAHGRYDSYNYQIILNGSTFRISENLWDFFTSSPGRRLLEEGLPIFVDAICIDQSSAVEKKHQIPLMSQIYSKAIKTAIWLGTSSNHTSATSTRRSSVPYAPYLDTQSFRHLTNNNYWERLWVVPELLLSGNIEVCVNDFVIPWVHITGIVDWPRISQRVGASPAITDLSPMIKLVNVKKKWDSSRRGLVGRDVQGPTLLDLMRQFSGLECQDERDKVYALLPLLQKELSISNDFGSSSTTTYDLLCQIVQHTLPELHEKGRSEAEIRDAAAFLLEFWTLSGFDQGRAAALISGQLDDLFPQSS